MVALQLHRNVLTARAAGPPHRTHQRAWLVARLRADGLMPHAEHTKSNRCAAAL